LIERKTTRLDGTERVAIFSDCERYRYRLWDCWDESLPSITYVMLNPSTADEMVNDPTVERCQRRAATMGYGRMEIANIFPLRSTDPAGLLVEDPLGPGDHADQAIIEAVSSAKIIIAAWGVVHKTLRDRPVRVMSLLEQDGHGDRLHHLGTSKDGAPRHPLYLSYDIQPTRMRG